MSRTATIIAIENTACRIFKTTAYLLPRVVYIATNTLYSDSRFDSMHNNAPTFYHASQAYIILHYATILFYYSEVARWLTGRASD